MCPAKLLSGLLIAGVEDSAVGEYESDAANHAIGVGMCAAAHAGGVVHHYAAYHG